MTPSAISTELHPATRASGLPNLRGVHCGNAGLNQKGKPVTNINVGPAIHSRPDKPLTQHIVIARMFANSRKEWPRCPFG